MRPLRPRRKIVNWTWHLALGAAMGLILLPLFLITAHLLEQGLGGINLDFFTELPKPVGETGGGMLQAILGTLYLVGLASILAIPLGVLCGIYLAEFGRGKLASCLRYSIALLTGVPSIVVGIFAYTLLVVPMRSFSALAGAFALSIIILPIVTRATEEIVKLIPWHIREAGLSLGLPRWRVILFIVLPGAFPGILTGSILAISRAAGETAPLLFTAFGNMYLSYSLFRPMASMPLQIYNYAIGPFEDWRAQAWSGSLVLMGLVLGLNLLSRIILHREALLKMLTRRFA